MPASAPSSSGLVSPACHLLRSTRSTGHHNMPMPAPPCPSADSCFLSKCRSPDGPLPASECPLMVSALQLKRGGYGICLLQPFITRRLGCTACTSNTTAVCLDEIEEDGEVVKAGPSQMVSLSGVKAHFLEERDEGVLSKRLLSLCRINKIRSALELFVSMAAMGLRPDSHACNSLLACLLRHTLVEDAINLFDVMRKRDLVTGHSFSLILKALAQSRGYAAAFSFFSEMEEEGMEMRNYDVVVFNTMLSICVRSKNWFEAERMWKGLKESPCTGTKVTYCLLVSSFVQGGQAELALSAYSEMIRSGLQPDEDTMKAIIAVSTKDGKWASALSVFRQMLDRNIQPNVVAYNAVINCLGRAGETDLAFEIYDLMRSSGHSPDVYTWSALLNALYRCRKYADTLLLFHSIIREKAELNVHLYNIALSATRRLGLWDRSLQLLWKMEESGALVPTKSYNLVIHACEHAKQPKVALQVYLHMVHKKCVPDTFTYLSLIRACVSGSLWNEVEDIMKCVSPNSSMYNELVHGLFLKGKTKMAVKLYRKMCNNGLKPDGKTRALMLQHLANDCGRRRPL